MKFLSIFPLSFVIAIAPPAALFENDQVQVARALEKPHVKGKFHEHKVNRVMVYLQAGKQRFEYQDGREPAEIEYKAGEVTFSPPEGMHAKETISNDAFNIIEIKLKKPRTGKEIATPLDPLKLDPKHVKLELENDQVRVMRVHIGPHEKVPMHEHALNRVSVFLTGQNIRSTSPEGTATVLQHKAGEAIWSTSQKHAEENLSDSPFEVLVVEIKD